VVVAEAGRLPFRQDCLAALVANSSLEHVIDLESALQEVHRTLLPGGRAYLTVPSGHFPAMLFHATWLSWLGMHQLARAYATWLNAYLEHRHIGNLAFWEDRLRAAGLHLLSVHTLLPRRALWLWEIGLPAQYFLRRLNRWLPWYSWLRRARARWLTGGLPELTITDGQEGAVWLLEVADE
jgi:SAM-dependent methyltransferase